MRAGRLLIVLTFLTAAGVALSRPGDVWPMAMRFVAPLLAQQQARQVGAEATLPNYIPGSHELSFKTDSSPADQSAVSVPTQMATAVEPAAITAQSPVSVSSSDAEPGADAAQPRHVDLIAEPLDQPLTTAALAPATETQPRVPAEAAPEAARTAALIQPLLPEDGSVTSLPDFATALTPKPTTPPIPAKSLFGSAKTPAAQLASRSIGSYARGCLSGGVALPVDGPAWQAMRLSRNRNWGHPKLVNLVERLATDAQKLDGWPGLLVGDLSQPRGGPMLTGHASHQVGLDADVWLTPMPNRKLSNKEREEINAASMLDKTDLAVDPKIFTADHVKLIKRAASYAEVERVLVHPAIKKALCEASGTDRAWLGKVRPIAGHYYHFHIRMSCPPGSTSCSPQKPPTGEDGCGKEVQEWLARVAPSKGPPAPRPPGYKPPPPKPPITLAQLPTECTAVLESGPDGVTVPAADKLDLKAIANAPAALRPHLRKIRSASAARK